MKRMISPGARTGRVHIPASKSQAHRLLICAALGEETCEIVCDGISADIAATAECLRALGAKVERTETGFRISPIQKVPEGCCELLCGESGSTLRFLLPVVGALGAQAAFHREGRLPQRPLAPLDGVLTAHGMTLSEEGDLLLCSGQLQAGNYEIAGNVSSQYISGLLMALPRLTGESTLTVTGPCGNGFDVAAITRAAGGKNGKIAVVGGGIGTAPLLQLCKELAAAGCKPELYCGFRDEPYGLEAFLPYCAAISIATDSGAVGYHGLVTGILHPEQFAMVLTCGPMVMMRGVYQLCAQSGTPCVASLERKMACGLGACLGCTCETKSGEGKSVCKNGPVFDATEVFF